MLPHVIHTLFGTHTLTYAVQDNVHIISILNNVSGSGILFARLSELEFQKLLLTMVRFRRKVEKYPKPEVIDTNANLDFQRTIGYSESGELGIWATGLRNAAISSDHATLIGTFEQFDQLLDDWLLA